MVGASAGGVEALQRLLSALPLGLPAAVLVVIHRSSSGTSVLPKVLDRAGPLPVSSATDGHRIHPGAVWVAVPDRHLLVDDGMMTLRSGPRENRHRPAVDPLFRTAARWYGRRVIAVVLSGSLDDGAVGAAAVHGRGGTVLTQDPAEARVPSMPLAAASAVPGARVARAADLGRLVVELVGRPVEDDPAGPASPELREENGVAQDGANTTADPATLAAAAAKLREESHLLRRLARQALETAEAPDELARRAYLDDAELADRRAFAVQRLLSRLHEGQY